MSALSIGTLRTTMMISREHPDPERVLRDVRSAIVSGLRGALAARLASAAPTSSAVWLVRRLQVDADVNAAWDGGQIAETLASTLVRSLSRELVGSGDGVNAIRFDTAAAHLARYLVDRVEGADRRWYHKRFDGLTLLPLSAALRAAIVRDAADGLAALQLLQPAARRGIVDALTQADTRQVLRAFASTPPRGSMADAFAAVARLGIPSDRGRSHETVALSLFLHLAGDRSSGRPLRDATDLIAQLTERVGQLSPADRATLADDLARGDLSIARHLVAELPTSSSLTLAAASAAVRSVEGSPAASNVAVSDRRWTQFGGVFLLLPDVEIEAINEVTLRFADDDATNTRCLTWFTAALALEGAWSSALEGDPVIRDFFGVPASVDVAGTWGSAGDVDRAAVVTATARALERFARRLPGFATSQPEYLRRNFLAVEASIEREPSRIVVRVTRPPLHVLLSMTGLIRRKYTLAWLGETPIEIFPEHERWP